jgi:hypothetical protein
VNNYYDPDNSFHVAYWHPLPYRSRWCILDGAGSGLASVCARYRASRPLHDDGLVNLPEGQAVMDPLDGQSLSREDLVHTTVKRQ